MKVPRNPNLPNLKRSKENDKFLNKIAKEEIDPLFNISYWLTGNFRKAKKLLKLSYFSAMEFYEQTYITTDYKNWLLRIVLKRFHGDFNKKDIKNDKGIIFTSEIKKEKILKILKENNSEKKLRKRISSLPSVLKNVLILHDLHGFNYDQTGDFIDVPDGVVCMRHFRARNLLFYQSFTENESSENIFSFTDEVEPDYPIASVLDDELKGEERRKKIEEKLKQDSILSFEFEIQKAVKNLLKDSLPKIETPVSLKKKLEKRINKATLTE
jgi:DNA-directed RNA polymerase specialized sigma24 family protein